MTMASGLYAITFRDALDTSGLAVDFLLDSHKIALVTDSHTPDFAAHDFYADITNELATAGGYTQPGKIITGLTPTFVVSGTGTSTSLKYDLTTDQSWSSASFTARGAIWYADALASDPLLFAHTFGADFTATNGTFTIQLDAAGAFTIDMVP
jgi:hypothetical protein